MGAQALLRYDVVDTGCCKILSHPRWQTKARLVAQCYSIYLFIYLLLLLLLLFYTAALFLTMQIYPATMFTTAPLDALVAAIDTEHPAQ